MATTLAELRAALAALGESTETRDLRGEERRAELLRRLRVAQGDSGGPCDAASDKRSLSELRRALEARGLPTRTPGLQGDARRHALLQRLLYAASRGSGGTAVAWPDEGERDEGDDGRSVASARSGSTGYSSARELLSEDAEPALELSRDAGNQERELEVKQDALFERRLELHELRRARDKALEAALARAGFSSRLEALSQRLEALAREQQRLERAGAGHELVSSALLGALSPSASAAGAPPLELLARDALELVRRHQRATRQLVERTKQAMALARVAAGQLGDADAAIARELRLEREVRELEAYLQTHRLPTSSRSSAASETARGPVPVLARCRSVPHAMFLHEWRQLSPDQREQLGEELRRAASVRIVRDRVRLVTATPLSARSPDGHRVHSSNHLFVSPSLADRLGVKARFLEASGRSPTQVDRAFRAALAADASHEDNLAHYAAFLASRGQRAPPPRL